MGLITLIMTEVYLGVSLSVIHASTPGHLERVIVSVINYTKTLVLIQHIQSTQVHLILAD